MSVRAIIALACVGSLAASELTPAAPIPLPGVHGRIDHFAADLDGKRLFVAALGADEVEVVDLARGAAVGRIDGVKEPQGLAWLPASRRLVIAEGEGSAIDVHDGASLAGLGRIAPAEDADNARVDPRTGEVLVGSGSGKDSALIVVDAAKIARIRAIPLPGHPEAFALEERGPRVFVNVPEAHAVVVADRSDGRTLATWKLEARANYPLALDEAHHRLLIGCRSPAKLLALDSDSGALVAELPCCGDADDIFIDAERGRAYVIGGEGAVTVVAVADPARYAVVDTVATRRGARTGWLDAADGRLYVACPAADGQDAQVMVLTQPTR